LEKNYWVPDKDPRLQLAGAGYSGIFARHKNGEVNFAAKSWTILGVVFWIDGDVAIGYKACKMSRNGKVE